MSLKIINWLKSLFKKKSCFNCKYGYVEYIQKGIYDTYTHEYKRSGRKQVKRTLVGWHHFNQVECKHPTMSKKAWAKHLKSLHFTSRLECTFKCKKWEHGNEKIARSINKEYEFK